MMCGCIEWPIFYIMISSLEINSMINDAEGIHVSRLQRITEEEKSNKNKTNCICPVFPNVCSSLGKVATNFEKGFGSSVDTRQVCLLQQAFSWADLISYYFLLKASGGPAPLQKSRMAMGRVNLIPKSKTK